MPCYDASERSCFRYCSACHRCEDKGRRAQCWNCTGRLDTQHRYDPYDRDDFCQCSWGVLRWRTRQGRLVVARYPGNPYGGTVRTDTKSDDEVNYERYVAEARDRANDPNFDPVRLADGTSSVDWTDAMRTGRGNSGFNVLPE